MTKLILGNLNYSSWSIRAALVARASGLDVEEEVVPLGFDETRARLIETTGRHTLPVLLTDGMIIRDSLAITEWIAEQTSPGKVWPKESQKRALARSVCAEMHSGFLGLRSQMPVDIRTRTSTPDLTPDLMADIERVLQIWSACRAEYAGDGLFLFGDWSAADAFFAPVATRFRTYGYALTGAARDYAEAVLAHPLIKQIESEADAEPWEIEMGYLGPVRAWVRD